MPSHNLDTESDVLYYLWRSGRLQPGEKPVVTILEGGVSNRAYLIERPQGEGWVLKQAREKLKVAVDWFCSPERIQREALGILWLNRIAPEGTVPELVFEDPSQNLLVMQAVPPPHENWKILLLRGEVHASHVEQFAYLLGTIHRVSHQRRDELASIFDDRRFFEDLRLEPYYSFAAEQVPDAAAFLHTVIEETRATRQALVHGDYSPKNVLAHRDRLILLDHEVIHWGDPAFDLGFSLTHFLSKAHHLTERRKKFLEAALLYWKTYTMSAGEIAESADLERRAVNHTLACMMARVAGRSPLEYLGSEERKRQIRIVLELISMPPQSLTELIDSYEEKLDSCP